MANPAKAELRWPFLVVNPKAYLYGDDIYNLAKQADAMARRLRELDNTLQQCNWTTDVEI